MVCFNNEPWGTIMLIPMVKKARSRGGLGTTRNTISCPMGPKNYTLAQGHSTDLCKWQEEKAREAKQIGTKWFGTEM